MTSLKQLWQEIKLRRPGELTARLIRVAETLSGSYERRLPAQEMTTAEFLKTLSYGSAHTLADFIEEHDALIRAWNEVPKDMIGKPLTDYAAKIAELRLPYGAGAYQFQGRVDWHHALEKQGSWPHAHWSKIPFRRTQNLGDIKACWEMNRHQFLPSLALAYLKTGDAAYVETFKKLLHGWCDQNTPEIGVNYISNLEIGLRCISWIFADELLRGCDAYDDATKERLHKNIHAQARHLAEYLPYTEKTGRNNHLIGDAASLAFVALHYPEFQESQKWLAQGLYALWAALDDQVFEDGLHFECSFGYQLFVTEFVLLLVTELRRRKKPVPAKCHALLEKMVDALARVQQPDGDLPNINDNDSGVVIPLPLSTKERLQGVFATAAVLYNRPDFRAFAEGTFGLYPFLLLGEEGLADFGVIPDYAPAWASLNLFKQAGIAVLRNRQGDYFLGKNNPDPFPLSGHNHADLLSFLLMFAGKPVLVDAGTYKYNADGGFRNALRSTPAHNTVTVDGKPQASHARNFGWTSLVKAGPTHAEETDDFAVVDMRHDSYDQASVHHRRVVLWLKREGIFVAIDRLEGEHAHHFEQFWHFPLATRLQFAGEHHYNLLDEREELRAALYFFRDGAHDAYDILHGSDRLKTSYVSLSYGKIEPAMTLKHSWSSDLQPGHASHRITAFCNTTARPAIEDVAHGVFRVCGYVVNLNETVVEVKRG